MGGEGGALLPAIVGGGSGKGKLLLIYDRVLNGLLTVELMEQACRRRSVSLDAG